MDELLTLRDNTQRKFYALKGLHQSDKPPNQIVIKFELCTSEKVKDVCDKEDATLCTAASKAKQEVSQWFCKLITQVAD